LKNKTLKNNVEYQGHLKVKVMMLHVDEKVLTKTRRKSLEAKNAPQMAIVYKGRTCNPNTTCTPRHDKENNLL